MKILKCQVGDSACYMRLENEEETEASFSENLVDWFKLHDLPESLVKQAIIAGANMRLDGINTNSIPLVVQQVDSASLN